MPERAELLVHRLFNRLRSQLIVLRVLLAGGRDHFDGFKFHVLVHVGMLKGRKSGAGSLMELVYRWAWRQENPLCSIFFYGFNESINGAEESNKQ